MPTVRRLKCFSAGRMLQLPDVISTIRWRLKRGVKRDATTVTRFLRRHPGASTEQISDYRWSMVPMVSRRDFVQYVTPELDRLQRFGVIEYRDGWYNAECPDVFARLAHALDGWELVDAFGALAFSYSQTIELRLAQAIAKFVANDCHDDDMRRFAYIHFLDVIGIPVSDWPNPLVELDIPTGLDWRKLNAFLPRSLRQCHASASLN